MNKIIDKCYIILEKFDVNKLYKFYYEFEQKYKYRFKDIDIIGIKDSEEFKNKNQEFIRLGKEKNIRFRSRNYITAILNFTITIYVHPVDAISFYQEFSRELIVRKIYSKFIDKINILSIITNEEAELVTYTLFCSSVVKQVFMDSIKQSIERDGIHKIEDHIGLLAHNDIFGNEKAGMRELYKMITESFYEIGCSIKAIHPDKLKDYLLEYFSKKSLELTAISEQYNNLNQLISIVKENYKDTYYTIQSVADENQIYIESLYD